MSLLPESKDEKSDLDQRSTNGLNKNGKNSNKTHIDSYNGNGLNNNHDEYKLDMKTNINDKVAEDDPLTGHRKWDVVEGSKEVFQPRWTQRFASTNFFMVIFLLAYVLQGKLKLFNHPLSFIFMFCRLLLHILCQRHHDDRETLSHQISYNRASTELQRNRPNLHVALADLFCRSRPSTEMDCVRNVFVFHCSVWICFAALHVWLKIIQSRGSLKK